MKTVAVIEGFSGGPMKSSGFRKALSVSGFRVVRNRRQADIIVAHSAGIYAVPPNASADLLLLIGPTYWPGIPLLERMRNHMRSTKHYHVTKFGWRYYSWRKVLEVYYFFTRNRYMWLGIIHNNRLDRLEKIISVPNRKTIIIRNTNDSYSSAELKEQIKNKNVKFIELPGIHDDYYSNPKPYVDLLLKEI